MELKDIHPEHKKRRHRRVGRGGKRGTYSGRGIKGQRARTGHNIRPAVRDLLKRIPKLHGVGFTNPRKKTVVTVSVGDLEKNFRAGERVTPKALLAHGLIVRTKGRIPDVKLLASGTLTQRLLVSQCQISKIAREQIEKAGGTVQ